MIGVFASCGTQKHNILSQEFRSVSWSEIEIYYVVKNNDRKNLHKATLKDCNEISSGLEKLKSSRIKNYPYPMVNPNLLILKNGTNWNFNFVFEDRIDFNNPIHNRHGFSVLTRNFEFYEWAVDLCLKDHNVKYGNVNRNQIDLRIGRYMDVQEVRNAFENHLH